MKILLAYNRGRNVKNPYKQESPEYDLDASAETIKKGINNSFQEDELIVSSELRGPHDHTPMDELTSFDIYLCDLTAHNPNIAFIVGLAKGLGRPVICFSRSDHGVIPVIDAAEVLHYSDSSLEKEFREALHNRIRQIKENPDSELVVEKYPSNPKAFISYSHQDKRYLDRLLVHLKPLERKGLLDVWQDSRMQAGYLWKKEIEKALGEASIAVLLISADFMASDFIVENELPPLLSRAEVKGTKIIPVILSYCRFSREEALNRFRAVNLPSEPLSGLSKPEMEKVFDKVATEIEMAVKA